MNDATSVSKPVLSGQKLFLLVSLSVAHTLMHCFQQGWYIILPSVKETFGLSDVQYGVIESVRSASSTAVQIPSGALSDILHKQWVIIVASAFIGLGAAYGILGIASNYGTVLFAAVVVGISIALWHPPALSVLSYRLSEHRGMALSIHGMGGNLGNAVGPAVIGIIIGIISWQSASLMMALPLLAFAGFLWLMLRNIPGREGKGVTGKQFISALTDLLRNKTILGLVICHGIRAMGTVSVFAFFSLYCRKDLGFSPAKAGMYFTLMMASGILSQPVLGYLSDRFGRKIVMMPSLVLMGCLEIILVWAGSGVLLALVAVCIGFFIYAVNAIIQAAAMDVTPEAAGATTIALLFGSSALFTIPSPTIAGWLSETFGTPSVFLFSGGLVLLSAFILLFLPMDQKNVE